MISHKPYKHFYMCIWGGGGVIICTVFSASLRLKKQIMR